MRKVRRGGEGRGRAHAFAPLISQEGRLPGVPGGD